MKCSSRMKGNFHVRFLGGDKITNSYRRVGSPYPTLQNMMDYKANIDPKYLHSEITAKILQGFYTVINVIGYSAGIELFKKALVVELESVGLKCEVDKSQKVRYKDIEIGEFMIDIQVDKKVNIKLMSAERITRKYEDELHNHLKLSDIEVGLLLNVYIEGEHRRKVFTNDLKNK